MEKGYEYMKDVVVNFKLDWCCWLAPVKIGLTIIGYFNILSAVISLVGIADGSFDPILVKVQVQILDVEDGSKPVPVLAYATELAFNVILLTALYRNDLKLMRVYMKYCIAAIIASIMFYSMVVVVIGIFMAITMVLSILFQFYVLVLVRSIIVKMRLNQKNLELPTVVMSSLIAEPEEKPASEDAETPPIHTEREDSEDEPARLETVDENPKEETTNEKE